MQSYFSPICPFHFHPFCFRFISGKIIPQKRETNIFISYLTLGGLEGNANKSALTVNSGTIELLQTVCRGKTEEASVLINNGTIENLYIGGELDESIIGVIGKATVEIVGGKIQNLQAGSSGGVEITKNQDNIGQTEYKEDFFEYVSEVNIDDLYINVEQNGKWGYINQNGQKVIDFKYEPCEREWDPEKLQAVYIHNDELELFADSSSAKSFFQVVNKLPYKFSYVLKTEDGIERTMMIEDWELGALYWNMLKKEAGDEIRACQKVREKYFDYMVKERDLYFFVGTTLKFHNLARNPFIIIGTFYPPKTGELFLDIF